MRMEIDTGSAVSLISDAVYKKNFQNIPLKPSSLILKTYTGEPVRTKGMIRVTVQGKGQKAELTLHVVKGNFPSLLDRSWLEEIKLDWPAVHRLCKEDTGLTTVLNRYPDMFKEELGNMKDIIVKLNIKPDSHPKFLKARPVPYAIRPKIEAELESLVKSRVLEPVSRSEWATPIVLVIKEMSQ